MTHRYVRRARRQAAFAAAIAVAALAPAARAQTDYYNTDAGRPLAVEDASPLERRAFELQLAPLRLERAPGGRYAWTVEPELAFGLLPRTQVELALPLHLADGPTRRAGLAGIELSALHNLNIETRIPALAIAADVLLPVGGFAPRRAYPSLKAIATKTMWWARVHANAQVTAGDAPDPGDEGGELSRWFAGVSVDRALPLRSLLLAGEVTARQPMHESEPVAWEAAGGFRYQYSPRWALDAGVGRRLSGADGAWFATFGSAYAFGLPWSAR